MRFPSATRIQKQQKLRVHPTQCAIPARHCLFIWRIKNFALVQTVVLPEKYLEKKNLIFAHMRDWPVVIMIALVQISQIKYLSFLFFGQIVFIIMAPNN